MKIITSKNPTKGFTLIEIIVVLIILGVLAATAVSSYFDWIKRAKVAEAILVIHALKDQVEPCVIAKTDPIDQRSCIINIVNSATSENFIYIGGVSIDSPMNYTINAISKNSDPAGDSSAAACGMLFK